jgi:hypothetical protein
MLNEKKRSFGTLPKWAGTHDFINSNGRMG